MEALSLFGCYRLASHIEVYRKQGHRIYTEMIHQSGKEFARYHYQGTTS